MKLHAVLTLLAAFALTGAARGQIADLPKTLPEVKRETEVDAKGHKQWAEHHQNCPRCAGKKTEECQHCNHLEKPEKCPECDTKRVAKCHFCVGAGELADPLLRAPCPGCNGHGWFNCHLCANRGEVNIVGGGKRGQKCASCKGDAGIKCRVCSGAGTVPSALKGKVGSADLKKLRKAKKELLALRKAIEAHRWQGRTSAARKEFKKLLKGASSLPPVRKLGAHFDTIAKGLDQPFKEIEKTRIQAWDYLSAYIRYYLLHQEKVLDLCIARAEFNAAVDEKAKAGRRSP